MSIKPELKIKVNFDVAKCLFVLATLVIHFF
jgi:hypothetical protein